MRLKKDFIFNYISLITMAASGLALNAVIVFYYDSSVLGVFNETYAWYVILSQASVWGIHMSVLKYVPEQESDENKGSLLKSAVLITALISTGITALMEIFIWIVPDIMTWSRSLRIAGIGLILIAVNKVLLNYLNAVGKMAAYAVFNSLRYLNLLAVAIIISAYRNDYIYLSLAFPVSELIVLLIMFAYIITRCINTGHVNRTHIFMLTQFGTRIMPSYMVTEMNTKVDVVCLGLLISDTSQIGIYSFAILFTEGFYMFYLTIRKMVNPGLAEYNVKGKINEYINFIKVKIKKYLFIGSMGVLASILVAYYLVCIMLGRNGYIIGLRYICIICVAMSINGKQIIFGDILAQLGYPLEESAVNVVTVFSNFVLNIFFILMFGVTGAAVATAISHFIFTVFLLYMVKKRTGLELR